MHSCSMKYLKNWLDAFNVKFWSNPKKCYAEEQHVSLITTETPVMVTCNEKRTFFFTFSIREFVKLFENDKQNL